MVILLSGKKGKLYESVAKALSGAQGLRLEAVPAGSQLLEATQGSLAEALVFTLSSEKEIEPLRWVMQRNPSLPLVAVLPRPHPRLLELLREESVGQIVSVRGLTAAQLRRKLRESLKALWVGTASEGHPNAQCAHDLHQVRSALTAIQGNAELALQHCLPSRPWKKQLEEILRGVEEIEKILRRLERALGSAPGTSD